MTDWQELVTLEQRRLLNSACGDLAKQVRWHGFKLSKDDWRHLCSGTVLGWRPLPGWDNGDGRQGLVMLGGSSLDLKKSECTDAITMIFAFGDDPSSQGINAKPVKWGEVVCGARGIVYEG